MKQWIDKEIENCQFKDLRLGKRFKNIMTCLSEKTGQSIPLAFQDLANVKAAYCFFSNPRIDEEEILSGHFEATKARFQATKEPVLIIQNTTEFSFQRDQPNSIGYTRLIKMGKEKVPRTICGLLMHSSFVVTQEGLPLGLAGIKFWTRKKFKEKNALSSSVNSLSGEDN